MADSKAAPEPPSLFAQVLFALAVAFTFFTILGFAGSWNYCVDLSAHFRVQYALTLLAIAAVSLLMKSRRVLAVSLFGAAINGAVILPLYIAPRSAIAELPPPLKIVAFNVFIENENHAQVIQFLRTELADVILLQEIDDKLLAAVAVDLEGYSVSTAHTPGGAFGIALLVRDDSRNLSVPQSECRDITGGAAGVESIVAKLIWHGEEFALLGIHTLPPMTEQTALARDLQLASAARWAAEQQAHGLPTIVIGDLNATPWSHTFRSLEHEGNLVNSQLGFGVQASFKATWPPILGIPIDHCLHSGDLRVIERRVGPGCESDHRPLVVRVARVVEEE